MKCLNRLQLQSQSRERLLFKRATSVTLGEILIIKSKDVGSIHVQGDGFGHGDTYGTFKKHGE
jgi:hypothetical protein